MINFNNCVTNILGTPGIISLPTSQAPNAANLAPGTIWINTTTGAIQQSNGATFNTIGGGGSLQGIDSVLQTNANLTANRNINLKTHELLINSDSNNVGNFSLIDSYIGTLTGKIDITEYTPGSNAIYTRFQCNSSPNIAIGLSISKSGFNYSTDVLIGDHGAVYNGTHLSISDNNQEIITLDKNYTVRGLLLNMNADLYNFGTEQYFIQVDNNNSKIQTFLSASKYGLFLDDTSTKLGDYNNLTYSNYFEADTNGICKTNIQGFKVDYNIRKSTIGDHGGTGNGTNIIVDDTNQRIELNGTLTVAGVHTPTGQHLQITINGTAYTIALLNP